HREVDRTSGQQRRGIRCTHGSPAIRGCAQSADAPRLFRLPSCGAADDRRVRVPQPPTLLSALDLPEAGPLTEIFHLPCEARVQRRSQLPGAVGAATTALSSPWFAFPLVFYPVRHYVARLRETF